MKNKLLLYAMFPVIGLGLLGFNTANAHGMYGMFGGFGSAANMTPEQIVTRQQIMFQNEAAMLGLNIDIIKEGWAEGKNLIQIAAENGITKEALQQKMKDAQTARLKGQLDALVANKIITRPQADKRMAFISRQFVNSKFHKKFDRETTRD